MRECSNLWTLYSYYIEKTTIYFIQKRVFLWFCKGSYSTLAIDFWSSYPSTSPVDHCKGLQDINHLSLCIQCFIGLATSQLYTCVNIEKMYFIFLRSCDCFWDLRLLVIDFEILWAILWLFKFFLPAYWLLLLRHVKPQRKAKSFIVTTLTKDMW